MGDDPKHGSTVCAHFRDGVSCPECYPIRGRTYVVGILDETFEEPPHVGKAGYTREKAAVASGLVLRSVYLEPRLDSAISARAEDEGVTKADLIRQYITDGLQRPTAMFEGYSGKRCVFGHPHSWGLWYGLEPMRAAENAPHRYQRECLTSGCGAVERAEELVPIDLRPSEAGR